MKEDILSSMYGTTSQKPMELEKLLALAETKKETNQIAKLLNEMCATGEIMTCTITKKGVTSTVYWLTGMPAKLPHSYGRTHYPATRPPRRDELENKPGRTR